MELLDRYLQAVGKYLPPKRRDDILAELRANLLEQAEDREAQLGHPFTLEEEEAFLKQHGRPVVVAVRYLPQQYLIGPTVFPWYLYALRTALPFVLLLYVLVNALVFLHEPVTAWRVFGMVARFPMTAVTAAVWITGIAVLVELFQARYLRAGDLDRDWSPRDLPPVESKSDYQRGPTVFEVIGGAIFLVFVLLVPHARYLIPGPGAKLVTYVEPVPALHVAYWAFVALLMAQWAFDFVAFCWISWRRARPVAAVLGRCGVAAIFGWMLMHASQLFVLTTAGQGQPQYQSAVAALNNVCLLLLRMGLIFLVVYIVWEVAQMIWRAVQSPAPAANVHKSVL